MTQGKKSVQIWILFVIFLTCALLFPTEVKGASAGTSQVGFFVAAALPSNQWERGKTYYDLHVEPGSEQKISFFVGNTGDVPIAVNLQINNAYTNTAGGIGYQIHGIKDESLLVSMEDISQLSKERVELEPDENEEVFITLKIPDESFNGEIIGGIVATKEISQEDLAQSSSIVNEYSYTVGLVVSENEEIVNPNIEFIGIKADLVNYRTAAIHSVRNTMPLIMNDVAMNIDIYKEGHTDIAWSHHKDNMTFAPNSLMDYTFYLGEEDIEAGTYESHVTIGWKDQQWKFEGTFKIELSTANQLNSGSIRLGDEPAPVISRSIAILLVSLLGLIIIVLILLVFRVYREMKSDEEI